MSCIDPYSGFALPPERRIIKPARRQRIVVALVGAILAVALAVLWGAS